jgi:hypothetical protein
MIERQEIYCHNCTRYVQFNLDLSMNGNHVLHCPNCGHEHCRVVKNGKITDDRWDTRNGPTIPVSSQTTTSSTTSTYMVFNLNSAAAPGFLYQSWSNTTTAS